MILLFISAVITSIGVIAGTCALKEIIFKRRVQDLQIEWEATYGAQGGYPIFIKDNEVKKEKKKIKISA